MDRAPNAITRALSTPAATASPRDAAVQLVATFDAVSSEAARVGWVHRTISADLGPAADESQQALVAAGAAIAVAIDADPAHFDRHPYHNRQHFCEVMLVADFLCRRHRLSERDSRRVVLAALIHDFVHDGARAAAFDCERRSIDRAAPYLVAAGVDATTRETLAALVLATDPHTGVQAALSAHRRHLIGRMSTLPSPPHEVADAAPELALLTLDAGLAHAATLLCEADLLPSVGLTCDHAMRLQDRLAQEWRCPLGPADKARFLDDVMDTGVIGAFFLPNVRALRQSLTTLANGRD